MLRFFTVSRLALNTNLIFEIGSKKCNFTAEQMDKVNDICFAAEVTLGKLAKWLRILGFDTLYEPDVTGIGFVDDRVKSRILLTRTERIRNGNTTQKLLFIKSNNPFDQLREVISAIGIVPKETQPFSRCIRCNTRIQQVEKESVQGMVPDYIWETHATFHTCSICRRIYWSGSHTKRNHDIIQRLFDS
jgi:hypothetical protein